jgi:inorganic triphosphatase YgiF
MGNEIELKLEVAQRDLRILKATRIFRHDKGARAQTQNLVSVYFDTPKRKLQRKGVSLRIRKIGERRIQTIKTDASDDALGRGEWEHRIKGDAPDLRKARGTPLAPLLTKKVRRTLQPVFETRVRRISMPLRRNGSRIEMALDDGQVCAGAQSAAIGEVELELKRGKIVDLFALARVIGHLVPAKLALESKSQRGYELAAGRTASAVRARSITLRRGTRTADGLRRIGRSILRHITANEPAVRKSDSEGVHQMRVGLRRLRAAMSLFSKLLGDDQSELIKRELTWLTGELAPARDLDVYARDTVAPVHSSKAAKAGMDELADELVARRAAAFDKARNALDSARYRCLLLDTLHWLESGDWAKHSRRRGNRPIERFAADILAKRAKKAMKNAKKLLELDVRQRHKLRIAIKKLRYAGDFFGSLFAGHGQAKRLAGFNTRLKGLQDRLGALNDIAVHQKLATSLAAAETGTRRRARAFAAGVVSGREQSEIEPLLEAAASDARKLARLRPFWN